MPIEDLQALVPLVRAGDERASRLMLAYHQRLFKIVCRAYIRRARGLDMNDLMQEASIGFLDAVRTKYQDGKGANVTTYCLHWADHACQRAIQNVGSVIRVPVWLHDKLYLHRKKNREAMVKGFAREKPTQRMREGLTALNLAWSDSPNSGPMEYIPVDCEDNPTKQSSLLFGRWSKEALAVLSPIQRKIVDLRIKHDMTFVDIAERLVRDKDVEHFSRPSVVKTFALSIEKMKAYLRRNQVGANDFF